MGNMMKMMKMMMKMRNMIIKASVSGMIRNMNYIRMMMLMMMKIGI